MDKKPTKNILQNLIKNKRMKLQLITYPAKILREQCEDVTNFNSRELIDWIKQMKVILKKHDGLGLAAPQVGLNKRLLLISPKGKEPQVFINPHITEFSDRQLLDTEGCLSIPNVYGKVLRSESIKGFAFDEDGQQFEFKLRDLPARVLQHEIDHINGKLFIDITEMYTQGKDLLEILQSKAQKDEL